MSDQGPWPAFSDENQWAINTIYDVSPLFLGDLTAYLGANINQLINNIDQVPGFIANTPYTSTTIQSEQTTTSTSYTNLTTVGPTLSNLPDGNYMVSWGCLAASSSATLRAVMGMSVNGAAPDDTKRAQTNATALVGVSFQTSLLLNAGGANTLTARYKVTSAGTGTFGSRYLTAIRVTGP